LTLACNEASVIAMNLFSPKRG